MLRLRTSLVGCFALLSVYAQPHQFQWARQFGASTGSGGEQARAAATDGSSNVSAGITNGAMPGNTIAGNNDVFVRKYDSAGNVLWTRQFGSANNDEVSGAAIDGSGNVIVSGTVCGTLPGQIPAGGCDAFVRKYDPAGNVSWTRQFGTAGGDTAGKLAVNATGDITVVGQVRGSLPGFVLAGSSDAYVVKLDASGAITSTLQFGTAGDDDANAVALDAAGNVVVGGNTTGAFPGFVVGGSADAYIIKFNNAGVQVWVQQFGSAGFDRTYDLATDASGNVFSVVAISAAGQLRKYSATGSALGTIGVGDSIYSVAVLGTEVTIAGATNFAYPGFTNLGGRDGYIRRLNASTLQQIWVQQLGTSGFDEAIAVAMSASAVFVAGHTGGAFPGFLASANIDLFARQYTSTGVVQWTDQISSAAPAQNFALDVHTSATRIFSAGRTDGTLPGGTRSGAEDAFIAAQDLAGNLLWLRQFGTDSFDSSIAVTADATGNVYVAGQTQGTLPGQVKTGEFDAFIRKYDAAGNELWTRQFGTANLITNINKLTATPAGEIVAVGERGGGGTNFNVIARKLDAAGNLVWAVDFGTSSNDYGNGLTIDATGGILIGGYTTGGTFPGQLLVGNADGFVARLTNAGSISWISQFGTGAGQAVIIRSVAVAADGSIYATGENTGAYPGQAAAGGIFDASVVKLNSGGGIVWARQFGSNQGDRALNAIVDGSGNVNVVAVLGTSTVTDLAIRRYDPNGNTLATLVNTTPQTDFMLAASGNADGIIATAGYTNSAMPGQTQSGALDVLVMKFLPPNTPPTVAANNALVAVNEGSTAANSGTFADANSGDVVTLSASIGTVVKGAGTWTWSAPAVEGPFAATVTITANDGHGGITTTTFNYTIANLPPALGSATGPTAAVAIGTPVTIAASVSDPGVIDPITCRFNWDDGSTDTVSSAASGACTAAHTFAAAGVYGVTITASDDDGGSATTRFEYVIVFDPTAGFVNGGGFINTPGGKANFGIVARYQKNAALPTGNTEFHAGSLNFDATAYEWLVLSGPNAQYKGTGKINGVAGYSFIITVTDAKLPGSGGVNKFRIRIWPTATPGTITYDNVPGAPDDINLANPQPLGGGSINIHDK